MVWGAIMLFPKVFATIFITNIAWLDFTAAALRIYCAAMLLMGAQIACQMTFVSLGNAPCSIIVAIVRKFVLLLPLIYIMPHILADRTRAIYMAEPVADVIAVSFTVVLFIIQFGKAMRQLRETR